MTPQLPLDGPHRHRREAVMARVCVYTALALMTGAAVVAAVLEAMGVR